MNEDNVSSRTTSPSPYVPRWKGVGLDIPTSSAAVVATD
eukprot:CAMPEP_0197441552 /NCGR_PEP_ID=MMETSP1175-20131217/7797_1 /TAXON_ID=1003142 /ORGANISM="Triceratium dubium, Strain CCMP147" /LENGTH=38 /DNA_ID= /DNA_START= /DNA_END= /DNA_ORIENTATION=